MKKRSPSKKSSPEKETHETISEVNSIESNSYSKEFDPFLNDCINLTSK